MIKRQFWVGAACASVFFTGSATAGELEVALFGGINWAAHSDITISKGGATDTAFIAWDGKSFVMPPYWGTRATYWLESGASWGFSLDYSHTKIYGDLTDAEIVGKYTVLEFSDGLNSFTVNGLYRHPVENSDLDIYGGIGVGIVVPHVEITSTGLANIGASSTLEYQVAGTTAQLIAGLSLKVADNWKVFGEARVGYVMIDASLAGGGSFKTNVPVSQLSIGLSYTFDSVSY